MSRRVQLPSSGSIQPGGAPTGDATPTAPAAHVVTRAVNVNVERGAGTVQVLAASQRRRAAILYVLASAADPVWITGPSDTDADAFPLVPGAGLEVESTEAVHAAFDAGGSATTVYVVATLEGTP